MACAKCESLPKRVTITTPDDLRGVIRMAAEAVAEGRLRELSDQVPEGNVPFATLAQGGPWDDDVSYYFKCRGCSYSFRIFAETYHGSGGMWTLG